MKYTIKEMFNPLREGSVYIVKDENDTEVIRFNNEIVALNWIKEQEAQEAMDLKQSKNWKNKTCETCTYQVNSECRLNPPDTVMGYGDIRRSAYKSVSINKSVGENYNSVFYEACSKYQPETDS